jgi:predicted transcriptional regulator
MSVLLSIRPQYVDEILNGSKKYEFRKSLFKSADVERVYIYSTAPIKKIVGFFIVKSVTVAAPEKLWALFSDKAGIRKDSFFEYFGGKSEGVAIEIGDVRVFDDPVEPQDLFPDFVPPQSFRYINDCDLKVVESTGCPSNAP